MAKQHSTRFLTLATEAQSRIKQLSPETLKKAQDNQERFFLVDTREESEWQQGHIAGAIHLSKGIIERDIEKVIADPSAKIVVYCSGGFRSCLAADNLQKMGYTNVHSLTGGLSAWQQSGYPLA